MADTEKKPPKENNLFKITDTILESKVYWAKDDLHIKEVFDNRFMINRALSQHNDCIMDTLYISQFPDLDPKMLYDYYYHSVRGRKRKPQKWGKPKRTDQLNVVAKYYHLNRKKAEEVLRLLSDEQVDELKQRLDTGGAAK